MRFKWSKEKCQEEAYKYIKRSDFKKLNASAYEAAIKNRWLDELFKTEAILKKQNK